jgi:hypothetical protein
MTMQSFASRAADRKKNESHRSPAASRSRSSSGKRRPFAIWNQ